MGYVQYMLCRFVLKFNLYISWNRLLYNIYRIREKGRGGEEDEKWVKKRNFSPLM